MRVCAWVCVFVCVCVCLCVCVCAGGGAGTGKCVWVWGLRYCIGGVGVALLPVSCKNGTKFARITHEIRTKFVPNSYEIGANFVQIWYKFRANFVPNLSPKCTVNVVVTNFVRNWHVFCTNFARISYEFCPICMNLYHFYAEQTHSAHSTQHSNTTTTQENNTVRSSASVTNEEQQTDEAQQAASKTTVPTQPKSRHYTHIMTISSNKHKHQAVTNYNQHKSIVPHDSTTGSHPSNHPHPLIAHSTATQQQHRRTTQSGHQQQSPVRSNRQTKHNKQQAKQRYQCSRKAGIKPT